MARFTIEHELPIAAETFWELLHTPEFEAFQAERMGLASYDEVSREIRDNVMHRRIRIEPQIQIPEAVMKPLRKQIGSDTNDFGYIEGQEKRLDRFELRWWVEPPVLKDRLEVGGLFRVEAIDAERCRRTMTADVHVRIFGLGTVIEKLVEKETRKTYDAVPGIIAAWNARNQS